MARIWCLLLIAAFVTLGLEARSNICLIESSSTIYKPVQIYSSDCPGHTDSCMPYIYNYSAPKYKSLSVDTIRPKDKDREAFVYLAQDENDNLDLVVITATSYTKNILTAIVNVTGASPADILVKDDPDDPQWLWDSQSNYGNFTWLLEPTYTDGVVIGHFKIVEDNACFAITYRTNWNLAIQRFVALSGTISNPVRAATKALASGQNVPTTFQFCLYPRLVIAKTDVSCSTLGSATATSLDAANTASYLWTKGGVTVGTTKTISNLQPGTYTLVLTANNCQATRDVVIESTSTAFTFDSVSVPATRTQNGRIDITITGGRPPFSIWWKNSAGTIIARNVTTITAPSGSYSVRVSDGCTDKTYSIDILSPDDCVPGTIVSGEDCTPCPAGTFSSTANAAKCTVCPVNTRNDAAGSTSCTACGANTVNNGGNSACSPCAKNTVRSSGASCVACPPGTQRDTTETECAACGSGSYRCSATGLCLPCPAGSFNPNGQSGSCEKCSAGFSQSVAGSTSCDECSDDTYAASGATTCKACPAGKHAPSGSSHILACV